MGLSAAMLVVITETADLFSGISRRPSEEFCRKKHLGLADSFYSFNDQ